MLPDSDASGGAAGSPIAGGGGGASGGTRLTGGEAGAQQAGGGAGAQAAGGEAGALGASGSGAGGNAAGGANGGGAGSGGAPACAASHVLVVASADTWIDAAQPQVNHGSDAQLFVLGGASEQRALLTFALPTAKAGAVLASAALVLTLGQAPNLGAASRKLSVHPLAVGFNEGRTTWLNFGSGAAKKWATPGGDFGADFGSGTVQAGDGALRLDARALVAAAYASKQTVLGLLVRDAEAAAAPINFAFISRKGAAVVRPVLDLGFCPP